MLTEPQILRVLGAELDKQHGKVEFDEGQHAIEARVSLRLLGTVEQGADQLIAPTARIPLHAVLALVCERGGIGRQRMEELIVQAVTEALERGEPVGDWIECSRAAERRATSAIIDRLPRVPKRGALRRLVQLQDLCVEPAGIEATKPPPRRRKRVG
jgi:hypothetical protein